MQRTAVIYGLAASTLVGAFFLVPRSGPVEAPPPPPPEDARPVTELVYSDGTLEVTARLDRGHVLSGADEPVWLDVGIKASGVAVRAPLTAVLVVDRSGSMAGDKIDAARMAAERFVLGLRPGDALGIVTFGSDVTVDLPLTAIDEASRARARGVVRQLEEGGGTHVDGALAAARRLLADAALAGRVGRVILVSDGRPTEGERRDARLAQHAVELRQRGVTLSTLGLGLDYNEDLMELLAVDGGGRFHHLRHAEQLGKILDDEFQHAASVVASGVRIYMPGPQALGGGLAVLDAPGSKIALSARAAIDVGDLAVGEERHILVKLQPSTAGGRGDILDLPAPEVTYRRAASNSDALLAHRTAALRLLRTADAATLEQCRRDDVRVRVLQVEASLALTASMQAWAAGDTTKARAQLEQKKADLEAAAQATHDAAVAAEAANIDRVLGAVGAAPAASAEGQDMIKVQKARAFQLRR